MARQRAEFLPYAVTVGDTDQGGGGRAVARFCHPADAQRYASEAAAASGLQHCVRDTSQRGAPLLFLLVAPVRGPTNNASDSK